MAQAKLCVAEECLNPAARGKYCWTHIKRQQRGQSEAPRGPSRVEFLREAAYTLADVRDDGASDADFDRANHNLQKAAHTFAFHDIRERIKAGMARAAAEGRKPGRPPTRDEREIAEVVQAVGGIKRAARLLRVARGTVRRAVRLVKAEGAGVASRADGAANQEAE